MLNILLKIFGLKITLLYGDPTIWDRWKWVKNNLNPGGSVLEAGCGSGTITSYAATRSIQATGISFDPRNMDVAEKRAKSLGITNVKFLTWDLRKLREITEAFGTFDQIICLECIEHIIDDKKLVSDLSARLKQGGQLLLTTPYSGYRPLLGDDPARLSVVEDGGHVRWGYSFEDISEIFQAAGLKLKAKTYVTGFISQMLTNLWRWLHLHTSPLVAHVVVFPLRPLCLLDPLVTRLLRYPHLSIAVVATKST